MLATAGALRPGIRVTTIPGRSLALAARSWVPRTTGIMDMMPLAVSLSRDRCGHGLLERVTRRLGRSHALSASDEAT